MAFRFPWTKQVLKEDVLSPDGYVYVPPQGVNFPDTTKNLNGTNPAFRPFNFVPQFFNKAQESFSMQTLNHDPSPVQR